MDYRLQVNLNNEELRIFEEIRKYYENLFQIKINNSMLLRFIIQKEWNQEHSIELHFESNKTDI